MTDLCHINDINDDDAKGFEVGEHSILAVKKDGILHTYVNWCPHLGIELNFMPDQFLDDENYFIVCANHGALFEIDSGNCVSGPCSGQSLVKIEHQITSDRVILGDIPEKF